MILAIDPGSKPGYAVLDTTRMIQRGQLTSGREAPRLVLSSSTYPGGSYSAVVVEGQWIHGRGGAAPKKILTLANTAGMQFARAAVGAWKIYRIPADGQNSWFAAFYRSAGVPQDILCNRIYKELDHAEQVLIDRAAGRSKSRKKDLLAAVGIGWALALCSDPEKYAIEWPP